MIAFENKRDHRRREVHLLCLLLSGGRANSNHNIVNKLYNFCNVNFFRVLNIDFSYVFIIVLFFAKRIVSIWYQIINKFKFIYSSNCINHG